MTSEVPNKRKQTKREKPEFKPGTFINYTLTDGDRGRFREWAASPGNDIGALLDRIVDDGYQLTVRYDDFSGTCAAFISPRMSSSGNDGFILSGRARSGSAAALGALFRHYALFEGDWPTDIVRKSALDDD